MLRSPAFYLASSFWLAALLPLSLPIARNFEYEYASLVAYLSLLLVPASAILTRPHQKAPPWAWALAAGATPLLLIAPAVIAFRTGLCLCAERDFYFWWLIQTGPHLVLAGAGFVFGLRWRDAGLPRRFWIYGLVLLFTLLFAHLAWTLWFHPQKRSTHLLAGFVHGAIYDNWIPVDHGVIWARLTHALLALSLLLLACLWSRKTYLALALVPCLGAYTSAQKAAQYPSQTHGLDALMTLMPEKRVSEGFTLHYRAFTSPSEETMLQEIFAAAQFHTQDLSRQLLVFDTHVHIFVYPSREAKKLWFGGDGTDITDVVTPSIHINLEPWPHSTLRHELVHALASSFAFRGLGFHPNLAFTEGLAVALAPHEEELSLHAGAADIIQSGRLQDPRSLFSPLFWRESGRRAYTVAGSILKFLIDQYGIGRVKQLYAGESWQSVFGAEADLILEKWRLFLVEYYQTSVPSIKAEALFRYPGILQDRCPHSKALLAKTGEDPLLVLRQPRDWAADRDYWPWRLALEHAPDVRLAYLRFRVQALWSNPDSVTAEQLIREIAASRHQPPKTIEDVELFLLQQDILIGTDRLTEAKAALQDLRNLIEDYHIGDALVRQVWARILLLEQPLDRAAPWLKLLAGTSQQVPSWRRKDQAWILRYLYVRNHRFSQQQIPLLTALARAPLPRDLPQTFTVEWYRSLGMQWMQLSRFQEAEAAFLLAAEHAPEGKHDALEGYATEARARHTQAASPSTL